MKGHWSAFFQCDSLETDREFTTWSLERTPNEAMERTASSAVDLYRVLPKQAPKRNAGASTTLCKRKFKNGLPSIWAIYRINVKQPIVQIILQEKLERIQYIAERKKSKSFRILSRQYHSGCPIVHSVSKEKAIDHLGMKTERCHSTYQQVIRMTVFFARRHPLNRDSIPYTFSASLNDNRALRSFSLNVIDLPLIFAIRFK